MTRLFQPFLWFLLVPYFAVAGLNVRPWIGESREHANRTNAQLTLALILIWPVLFVLPTAGRLGELTRGQAYVVAALLLAPAWFFVSVWLKPDRERHYAGLYNSMPRWKRNAFGIVTLAFVALFFWQVPVKQAPRSQHAPRSQSKDLICNEAAPEVTAETCST